jgi:hypothetical protein
MVKNWMVGLFEVMLFVVIFIAGFGSAVFYLWNHLLPRLFGLPEIGFWQAVGLLALSWLLFGGWRGVPRGGRHWRRPSERFEQMTTDQRERFVKGLEGGCRSSSAGAEGT